MSEEKKCRWQDRDGEWHECEHKATHDDGTHCIFHALEKKPEDFTESLKRTLESWISQNIADGIQNEPKWQFAGFIFPAGFSFYDVLPERERSQRRKIKGNVAFSLAIFEGGVEFSDITFDGMVNFDRAEFNGTANFWGARFPKDCTFYDCIFFGKVDLGFEDESNRIKLLSPTFRRKGYIDLSRARFSERIEFYACDCSLSRLLLGEHELKRLQLTRCFYESRSGHAVIADELLVRWNRKRRLIQFDVRWDVIRRQYEKHLAFFKERSDYQKVYLLTPSVFEMRRLSPPIESKLGRFLCNANNYTELSDPLHNNNLWTKVVRYLLYFFKRHGSLLALYKWVSLYSGSMLLPLLWLLFFTCIFACLYACAFQGEFFHLEGLRTSLHVAALDRRQFAELISTKLTDETCKTIVTALGVLQTILTATFVTLFIFAIRRRFKH